MWLFFLLARSQSQHQHHLILGSFCLLEASRSISIISSLVVSACWKPVVALASSHPWQFLLAGSQSQHQHHLILGSFCFLEASRSISIISSLVVSAFQKPAVALASSHPWQIQAAVLQSNVPLLFVSPGQYLSPMLTNAAPSLDVTPLGVLLRSMMDKKP